MFARTLLDKIKSGEKQYDFVEVMACPGGCANGGGMPIHPSHIIDNKQIADTRAKGLYNSDVKNKVFLEVPRNITDASSINLILDFRDERYEVALKEKARSA